MSKNSFQDLIQEYHKVLGPRHKYYGKSAGSDDGTGAKRYFNALSQKNTAAAQNELKNQVGVNEGLRGSLSDLQGKLSGLQGQYDSQFASNTDLRTQLNKALADLKQKQVVQPVKPPAYVAPQVTQPKIDPFTSHFQGKTIYDTQQMLRDITNTPGYNSGALSWHPAAHFLRNNNNYTALPNGQISNRYGAYDSSTVEKFFNNKANYPANVSFPYKLPTISVADLQNYSNGTSVMPKSASTPSSSLKSSMFSGFRWF